MNQLNKHIVEFLINEDFIKYVTHPTLKLTLQWQSFFKKNPSLTQIANEAKLILLENGDVYKATQWEINDVKKRIINECGISSFN